MVQDPSSSSLPTRKRSHWARAAATGDGPAGGAPVTIGGELAELAVKQAKRQRLAFSDSGGDTSEMAIGDELLSPVLEPTVWLLTLSMADAATDVVEAAYCASCNRSKYLHELDSEHLHLAKCFNPAMCVTCNLCAIDSLDAEHSLDKMDAEHGGDGCHQCF